MLLSNDISFFPSSFGNTIYFTLPNNSYDSYVKKQVIFWHAILQDVKKYVDCLPYLEKNSPDGTR